jgi:hypothetical protein
MPELMERVAERMERTDDRGVERSIISRNCGPKLRRCVHWGFLPAAGLLLTALAISRVYIVEAFISIRSLPLGSYRTVEWVNFLPRIG